MAVSRKEAELFRVDAVRSANTDYDYLPILQFPFHLLDRLLLGIFSFTLLAIASLFLFSVHERVSAEGYLSPQSGAVDVFPIHSGIIQEYLVEEGQRVSANEPIATIKGLSARQALSDGIHELTLLKQQLSLIESDIRDGSHAAIKQNKFSQRQMEFLQQSIRLYEEETTRRAELVNALQGQLDRARVLNNDNLLSDTAVEEIYKEMLLEEIELKQVERQLAIAESDLNNARSSQVASEMAFDRQQQKDKQEKLSLERKIMAGTQIDNQIVYAPVSGIISQIFIVPGTAVNADTPLLWIETVSPKNKLILFVEEQKSFKIENGMPVEISYGSYPAVDFGVYKGIVERKGRNPVDKTGHSSNNPEGELLYRQIDVEIDENFVRLDDQRVPLVSRQTAKAKILIDKVPLWKWLTSS